MVERYFYLSLMMILMKVKSFKYELSTSIRGESTFLLSDLEFISHYRTPLDSPHRAGTSFSGYDRQWKALRLRYPYKMSTTTFIRDHALGNEVTYLPKQGKLLPTQLVEKYLSAECFANEWRTQNSCVKRGPPQLFDFLPCHSAEHYLSAVLQGNTG